MGSTTTYGFGDLAKYGLGNACDFAQDEIERAAVHVLHTYVDLAVRVESAVEADYVGRVAFVQNGEFAQDLVANGRLHFQMNQLRQANNQSINQFRQEEKREREGENEL